MSTQRITGDMCKIKSEFNYDVYGQNALTGFKDTTWRQKNVDHVNHRVRKIFRFGSQTPQFKAEKAKWAKLNARTNQAKEETKEINVSASTEVNYQIKITGYKSQIEAAEKEIRRMFAEETNHFSNYGPVKNLGENNFRDLWKICQSKFNVSLTQTKGLHSNVIKITGRRHLEANKWFADKFPAFEKLNFPQNWQDVVKNYFTDNYITQYDMQSTEQDWRDI